MNFNIWQGEKVRLRAVEPEDWEAYFQDSLDSEAARLNDAVHLPRSAGATRQWAQQLSVRGPEHDNFQWAIEAVGGGLVGMINTHHCNVHNGTFMYGVGIFREHWRKGCASEAIRLVLRYYFQDLRYQKVTVELYAFNEPSVRLHQALGFQREGRLRRMVYTGGEFHDVLVYGLTAEEFRAARSETSE